MSGLHPWPSSSLSPDCCCYFPSRFVAFVFFFSLCLAFLPIRRVARFIQSTCTHAVQTPAAANSNGRGRVDAN